MRNLKEHRPVPFLEHDGVQDGVGVMILKSADRFPAPMVGKNKVRPSRDQSVVNMLPATQCSGPVVEIPPLPRRRDDRAWPTWR
jgi:hypothetical protein